MRNDRVLLSHLLIESIVEEYNVDEGIRDMAKKGAAIAAFGAASTIGAYNIGKNLVNKKEVPQKVQQVQAPEKKELAPHAYMLLKQAYAESRFNPKAESPKGAKGLTQIMPSALEDYMKRLNKKTKEKIKIDLNNIEDAIKVQVDFMSDLYNRGFIKAEGKNQPEEVRIAKTLAAYNYGPKNLFIHLQEKQKEGVDIYKSLEWMEGLPKETVDYIDKVSPEGKNSSFNSEFKKAIESGKFDNIVDKYRKVNNLKK